MIKSIDIIFLFYILVGMCLAFEIHKMFDFKNFSRMSYLIIHYSDQVKNRKLGKFLNSVIKISFTNIFYFFVLLIGVFGFQGWFFTSILMLSIISNTVMKKTKQKTSLIIYLVDSILSMIILVIILINFYFFQMGSIDFLKYLITLV